MSAEPEVSTGALNLAVLAGLRELESACGVDIVTSIAAMFCQDSRTSLTAVRAAVETQQTGDLLQALHKMRGAAANIGASQVAAVCLQFETSVERGQGPSYVQLLDRLADELGRAERALAVVLAVD